MKYFLVALSILTLIGFQVNADQKKIGSFAKKLRDKEVYRWDKSRFYGKLDKAKVRPKKTGIHRIFEAIKKRKSSSR